MVVFNLVVVEDNGKKICLDLRSISLPTYDIKKRTYLIKREGIKSIFFK